MQNAFYGGLDFSSIGAKISIIDSKKELKYSNFARYKRNFRNPNSWIYSCEKLLDNLPLDIKSKIVNLAISGVSEIFISCALNGDPIGEAILYNQSSNENKNLINSISNGADHIQNSNSYSYIAKALKPKDKDGEDILLRHQSDWITGWFMKNWTYGGEVNNLKLGWDLIRESWSANVLNKTWGKCLPLIIKSGEIIGKIDPFLANRFKLNKDLLLISGTTDLNAALLAAELDKEEGLTVLGNTIIVKKISENPIIEKGIINHKLSGDWICGGESNAGCGILSEFFSDFEIKELSRQINTSKQTSLNLLPLNSSGEIFPVNNPFLEPILSPRPVSDSLYLHALFEGLARIELRGWEKLNELTGSLPKRIVTIGSGSRYPQWRVIREKIINIPIVSCKKTISFGTALLAINAQE